MKTFRPCLLIFLLILFQGNLLLATQPFDLIDQEPNLINLIHRADPELAHCSDPLEIATRLLPILCDITVTTLEHYQKATQIDHNACTAQEYYSQAVRNYEVTRCGGRNTLFKKILTEYFHIDAFTINMGSRLSSYTHVVTLLPIKHQQGYRFYLFDAHYGCYYVDHNESLLDLESIFSGAPFKEVCCITQDLSKTPST